MKKNLCVLLYNNPKDEIRGKTRRYFYEVRPNVFVGTIQTGVRDTFWSMVENSGTNATIIYHDNNEQGFSYKSTQNQSMFLDFDGIVLPTERKAISVCDVYAKPNKRLIDHLFEAGAMAKALLTYGRGKDSIFHISELFNVDVYKLIDFIAFLVASHDIGKAHPGFQKKLYSSSKNENLSDSISSLMLSGLIDSRDPEDMRHERYSRDILYDYFDEFEINKSFADVVAFHHQGKERSVSEKVFCFNKEDERWNDWKHFQRYILNRLRSKWNIDLNTINSILSLDGNSDNYYINGFLYFILSVMVTSDWIVSGTMWQETLSSFQNVDTTAEYFIKSNELLYTPMKERFSNIQWGDVFDFSKNSLQEYVTSISDDYYDMCIVEYPCGYGKTEAALASAIKVGMNKSGIYLAAPTTSTAKGLADRCRKIAQKAGLALNIPELDSSMIWSDSDMGKIPKSIWSNRTRHQLLYPFSVGTIDQLLKSIISYRYSCIGLLGLSDKVVIVDEVHAYDAYMLTELECLIRWCRFLHVPVIILSATLPTQTKKKLCKAAGFKENLPENYEQYPLVTTIKNREITQTGIECKGKKVNIKTEFTDNVIQTLFDKAIEVESGCLALITPTIDNAFELYDMLLNSDVGCEVVLYHGRMTVNCKTGRVKKLLHNLGKDRSNRPEKMIVVATSIIEQSLDVDFDYMFTAIAPIDLLIQRLGRVHRHSDIGTIREHTKIDYPFTVVIPNNYGNIKRIYDEEILERTKNAIKEIGFIDTVESVRNLIDTVYNNYRPQGDRISAINASRNILSDPTKQSAIETEPDNYAAFNTKMPQTREESYPTIDVIILNEQLPENYTFSDIRNIMLNNKVSSVPVYKNRHFLINHVETGIDYFDGCSVYISENLCVVGDDGTLMKLTDDGLRFEDG